MSKKYVFTINNPQSADLPQAWSGKEHVRFCVWQKEVGANGTPHLQGYLLFSQNKTLKFLKEHFDATAHWETRKGTHDQAKAYCIKEESRVEGPWQYGEEPVSGQGGRSDLKKLKEALDAGKSEKVISDEMFSVWSRNFKAIERYSRLHTEKNRAWPTITTVYWGPPGTGKTRRVLAEAGADAYWMAKPGNNQTPFFDGYAGQEDVVIDEFFGWLPRDLMCRMCDRYPLMVQTKGGMTNFYPKRIWITSNSAPSDWWSKIGLGPMERRLSDPLGRVVHMVHQWVPQPIEDIPLVSSVSAELAVVDALRACKKCRILFKGTLASELCNVCLKVDAPHSEDCICDACHRVAIFEEKLARHNARKYVDLSADADSTESLSLPVPKKRKKVVYDSDAE